MDKKQDNLAYLDDLTGLYNRRYLKKILPEEISKAKKNREKLCLFMIDYDGFKQINDTYGHLGGDRVLVEIAGILKKEIGNDGILMRYAGDEFTIILPRTKLEEFLEAAGNLLRLASECEVTLKDGRKLPKVTLSIGAAVFPDNAGDAEELMDKADQALYSSKRRGKNRVSTIKDLVDEVRDRDLLAKALPCWEFIDRKKEKDILEKAYSGIEGTAKKLLLIDGGPGMGKTRIMLELSDKCPTLLLKCRKEDILQQYGAISNALNGFLGSMEASKVLGVITSLEDIQKYALVSTVDKVKPLPISYSKGTPQNVKELSEKDMFLAFTNFLDALNLKRITALVDDILWIDKGSLKVVNWLLDGSSPIGALVAGTLGDDSAMAGKAEKTPFGYFLKNKKMTGITEKTTLGPLTKEAVSELLKAVFRGISLPADIEEKIFTVSGGVPSAVEEIIRNLLDNKIVYPKDGKWVIDQERLGEIPVSVQELLNKRIAGLDDESRGVLSRAAVLGNDFGIDALGPFSGKNEGWLLDILDSLTSKGILQKTAQADENTLSFVNKNVKENIYGAISGEQLKKLHGEAARLLENANRPDIGGIYGKLQHHLEEAGETDKLESLFGRDDLPPYLREAVFEEAGPSLEEAAETPLSEESLKIAPSIAYSLRASWINSQLYPKDNKMRMDSIEGLGEYIAAVLKNDRTLTITASEEDVIFNGAAISKKKVNPMLSRGIVSLFSDYGMNSLTFRRGLRKDELESLFLIFAEKADLVMGSGGPGKLLKERRIENIKVDEVRYRKASDFTAGAKKLAELYKRIITACPSAGDIFSIGEKGLTVKNGIARDTKKAIGSVSETIKTISGEGISENSKSLMILDVLGKLVAELEKGGDGQWKGEGKGLGGAFLSLDPLLRANVIKEGSRHGKGVNDFITNALSGLDRKDIVRILKEKNIKDKLSREEFSEFSKVIAGSQYLKNTPYEDIQAMFEEAGIKDESSEKVLNNVFGKSFFDKAAKDVIEGKGAEALDEKAIGKLRPLAEALLIKGDLETVKKLVKSLFEAMASVQPVLRISALKGIRKVSEVLIEKEVFDICASVCDKLSERLKLEKDIKVYEECTGFLAMLAEGFINKQNLALVTAVLEIIRSESLPESRRDIGFRDLAEKAIGEALKPGNMDSLLISFEKKQKKEYAPIIDLMSYFQEKTIDSIMNLLSKKEDSKQDPFVTYMKKQHIAIMMQKMGEKAISRLRNALDEKDPLTVKNAVEVLGNMKDKKHLPHIERAIKHPDVEVQREASIAARKLKRQKR